MMRAILLPVLLFTGVTLTAQTAPQATLTKPFVFGAVHAFHSKELDQERTLNVYLPDGYSPDSAAYPVVYVLDGSANEDFPHIAGLVQFMNMYDLWPKSIVVGIANVDRRHDLTYPSQDTADQHLIPTAGGSAAFMRFLGNEVEPFIQANYHAGGPSTLIGQSLGGLFATEVLFTRPELFDNYIIVSPSIWWDKGSMIAKADAFLTIHPHLARQVFFALGSEGDEMQQDMDKLVAIFKTHAGPELKWYYETFPAETHATILHRAVYRAFEVLYPKK